MKQLPTFICQCVEAIIVMQECESFIQYKWPFRLVAIAAMSTDVEGASFIAKYLEWKGIRRTEDLQTAI